MTAVAESLTREHVAFGPDSALIDADFVRRRWNHRRTLRTIPDWIVKEVSGNVASVSAVLDHPDRTLMEAHLRDVADRLTGQLRLTLEHMETATLAAATVVLYDAAGTANLELLQIEQQRAISQPLVAKHATARADFGTLDDVDHEGLAAFITAAVWADELASDYRDPRVSPR